MWNIAVRPLQETFVDHRQRLFVCNYEPLNGETAQSFQVLPVHCVEYCGHQRYSKLS